MQEGKINIEKKVTLREVLEELSKNISDISAGQIYEAIQPIYPDSSICSAEKNIEIDGMKLTLPLAVSAKAKKEFIENESVLAKFYEVGERGDFLMVEKVNEDGTFTCRNISMNKEMYDEYYRDNPILNTIKLGKDDIAFGNIKRVYRGIKSLKANNK